jgi:hypothetical protein
MFYPQLRAAFESFANPRDSARARQAGAAQFVERFRSELGLSVNVNGRPTLVESARKWRPADFSLRGLAESLVGYEWVESLQGDTNQAFRAFEAGADAAITPGSIPNVSAYLGSVIGLLDAAILEAYETPDFIIDELIPVLPSKTRQKKLIGTGRIGDQARRRNPGEGHQFAQFSDRRVVTSETYNDALAGQVTFEAVYFDQTDEVLQRMNGIGEELGLRKELDGFRLIAGINNPYNYNGVGYNTYQTSGYWINKVTGNELIDWTDVNVVNAMFGRMTDQETSNRIAVSWDTILCAPGKKLTAEYIQAATEIETRTASSTEIRRSKRLGETYRLMDSPYLDQVLTDAAAAGGAALSQSDADKYWWALKTDKNKSAFVRVENWPVTINRARPDDYQMLNQKLMLAIFADQMHSFDVREPRYVILSTG